MWRNDPVTCQNSFTSAKVSLTSHKKWFEKILLSEKSVLLISEKANRQPFGVIRYDQIKKRDWEVHINIAPKARGKGWGQKALKASHVWMKRHYSVSRIVAKIKQENVQSIQAFERAGYTVEHKQNKIVTMRAKK